MMRIKSIKVLVFVISILFSQSLYATDRHVGSGQTYSTIQAAVTAANSSDTITIHSGTYTENITWKSGLDNVTVSVSGSDSVKIQPSDNNYPTIIVSGDVQNVTWDGKQAGENSQMWIVGGSSILESTGTGQCFRMVRSSSPALSGITLTRLKLQGTDASNPIMNANSDGASDRVDNIVFSYNYVYGNYSRATEMQGINEGTGATAWRLQCIHNIIDVTGSTYSGPEASHWDYCLFDSNYIYGNSTVPLYFIQIRKDQNCQISNNVFYQSGGGNTGTAFIILRGNWGSGSDPNYASNNLIVNNTFDNQGTITNNGCIFLTDSSSNNIARNNLFIGSYNTTIMGHASTYDGTGNSYDNNRKSQTLTWATDWTDGGSNTTAADIHVGSGTRPVAFYALTGSYNGNATSAPSDDYSGTTRGSPPDIGAFEYGEGSPSVQGHKGVRMIGGSWR